MGVEFPDDEDLVRSELERVKHYFGKKWGNISFQFGVINELTSCDNARAREKDIQDTVKTMRLTLRNQLLTALPLQLSFKENMPQSTIVIKLSKSDEELLTEMNSGCSDRIKKAIKKGVKVRLATEKDFPIFFDKWQKTAGGKGFSTITRKQFDRLIPILLKHNWGNVFVSELNGELIAGSICLFCDKMIVYLYGFTDRKYTNI